MDDLPNLSDSAQEVIFHSSAVTEVSARGASLAHGHSGTKTSSILWICTHLGHSNPLHPAGRRGKNMRNGKWKVFVRNDSVASIRVLFPRNQARGHRPRHLISTVQLEFQGGDKVRFASRESVSSTKVEQIRWLAAGLRAFPEAAVLFFRISSKSSNEASEKEGICFSRVKAQNKNLKMSSLRAWRGGTRR